MWGTGRGLPEFKTPDEQSSSQARSPTDAVQSGFSQLGADCRTGKVSSPDLTRGGKGCSRGAGAQAARSECGCRSEARFLSRS